MLNNNIHNSLFSEKITFTFLERHDKNNETYSRISICSHKEYSISLFISRALNVNSILLLEQDKVHLITVHRIYFYIKDVTILERVNLSKNIVCAITCIFLIDYSTLYVMTFICYFYNPYTLSCLYILSHYYNLTGI